MSSRWPETHVPSRYCSYQPSWLWRFDGSTCHDPACPFWSSPRSYLPLRKEIDALTRERTRMALGKGPSWSTQATIDGLPAKNWTTREGVTMRGTFSQCVKRWLELNSENRQDCSIGWGPNEEGQWGYFERLNIVGYLERNGPPPDMGDHVTIQHVRNWLSVDKLRPPVVADKNFSAAHSAEYQVWVDSQKTAETNPLNSRP